MNYILTTLGMKPGTLLITLITLMIAISSKSQYNVSYNANSIPINGSFNTALGLGALYKNAGSRNVGISWGAFGNNTSGWSNIGIGTDVLSMNETGSRNVVIGDSAGFRTQGSGNVFIGQGAGTNETGSNKFYLANTGGYMDYGTTLIYGDFNSRQLLLGVGNPTGYVFKGNRTLNVVRGILTDSIRLSHVVQWADYVFDENYPLRPISELSEYVRTHKHLPNIPTTEEVNSNGIELGSMNAKLLEKIEELTLYVMQLQEQINELKKQGKAGK